MDTDFELPVLPWIACFHDTGNYRWWHRFLEDGFAHVTLMGFQPHMVGQSDRDSWLYVDYQRRRMNVLTIPPDSTGTLFSWLQKHQARFVEVPAVVTEQRNGPRFPHLGGMNCVEVAKQVLAFHNPAILTPYQLYRTLLSSGGRELEDDDGIFL